MSVSGSAGTAADGKPAAAVEDEPASGPVPAPLLAYLRLVRAPAVFSALGDPLVGLVLTRGRLDERGTMLALAAGSLYLAGMALNDVADRAEDARDRPERPLPSGAISAPAAVTLGAALVAVGVMAARRAGAPYTGGAVAASVVAYDFWLKSSPLAGPVAMGTCRSLSLLMGSEAGDGARGIRRSVGAALLLGAYVAGVTTLARGETGRRAEHPVRRGALLAGAALGLTAVFGRGAGLPWIAGAAAIAAPAVSRAMRDPVPSRVGPAVGAMIRAIPAIGGALAASRSPGQALALLPLLGLARWGRELIPVH